MASPSKLASGSVCERSAPDATLHPTDPPAIFELINSRYDVASESVTIGNHQFSILGVRDTNALVDAIDPASFAVDERLPYWAELWSSSIELARVCLNGTPFHGQRVLELGCGLGLAGIAAARSGGEVTMTDIESDALLFARWNLVANLGHDAGSVRLKHLDWRAAGDVGQFDAVIGSDILYEERHFDPILDLLAEHLAPGGCGVFTDPSRRTGEPFCIRAAERGFFVETAIRTFDRRGRQESIVLFTVRRRVEGS